MEKTNQSGIPDEYENERLHFRGREVLLSS